MLVHVQAIVKLQKAGWGRPPREPVSTACPSWRVSLLWICWVKHIGALLSRSSTDACFSLMAQVLDKEQVKAVLAYYQRKQQEQEVCVLLGVQ